MPSFASTGSPVTVTRDNDSTTVGVHDGNEPVAGVTVYNDGHVCGGIGLGVPVCTPSVLDGVSVTIPQQEGPVTIDTSNGVGVGVTLKGQPIAGAHVSPSGQACVGVSLEVPFCTPDIGTATSHAATRQKLPIPPVTLRHDDTGTAVGVGDVGVVVYPDGTICPVVSTQAWKCIPGGN